jgi:hypothetical protein
MNRLLTALILTATAATAHAVEPEFVGYDSKTGQFIDAKVTSVWDKFVCMGAGTCYRDLQGDLRKACSGGGCSIDTVSTYIPSSGIRSSQIHLPSSSYMVIHSGSSTSVIQTAK